MTYIHVVRYTFLSCKVGMKRLVCKFFFRCYAVCVYICMCLCVRVCVRRPMFELVRACFCRRVIVQFVCARMCVRVCTHLSSSIASTILRCISYECLPFLTHCNVSDQHNS